MAVWCCMCLFTNKSLLCTEHVFPFRTGSVVQVRFRMRCGPKPAAKKCGHVPLRAFSTASVAQNAKREQGIMASTATTAFGWQLNAAMPCNAMQCHAVLGNAEVLTCLSMRVCRIAWATSSRPSPIFGIWFQLDKVIQSVHRVRMLCNICNVMYKWCDLNKPTVGCSWPLRYKKTQTPNPDSRLP